MATKKRRAATPAPAKPQRARKDPKEPIAVTLTPEVHRALEVISQADGMSRSQIIELAVRQFVRGDRRRSELVTNARAGAS